MEIFLTGKVNSGKISEEEKNTVLDDYMAIVYPYLKKSR